MKNLFILFLFPFCTFAQSMVDVFKKLPAECTPGISLAERDSLIKYGTYVIPGGDSIETTRYEISSINANDYLNYYFNFITGQRAFIDFELRKYYATPESGIIVFSEYGGLPSNYSQHDLRLFRFDKNGFTEILNQKLLPKKISVTKFLKKETSDSIIRKIENYSNFCFNLETSDPNTLEFILDCKDVEGATKWVRYEVAEFSWNGKSFSIKYRNSID